MILPLAKVLALAASCGAVSASQLIALPGQLQQESGYDTLAIDDNTLGVSFHPATEQEAVAFVLAHRGDSIDAGILQINTMNWPRLGLTPGSVFDPQANVCAGLQILKEGLSVYNTGAVTRRGLAYAARVLTAASQPNSPRVQHSADPRGGGDPPGSGAKPFNPHEWHDFDDKEKDDTSD
jgi:hypothetical protein